MSIVQGYRAYIWLSQRHIYVLKTETSWYGGVRSRQLCLYDCPGDWLAWPEKIKKCLRDIIAVYGLQDYTTYLLLSGPSLLWKALKLATKRKEEARSMVVWDEAIGDGSTAYAFDLARTAEPPEGGLYGWMSAAYPYDMVTDMIQTLRSGNCCVRRIDVLPAAAGRLCPSGTGILYLCEPALIHVVQLKSGVPLSYACTSALPEEGRIWQEAQEQMHHGVWYDEEKGMWSIPPVSESVKRDMDRWELVYPAAVLAAY